MSKRKRPGPNGFVLTANLDHLSAFPLRSQVEQYFKDKKVLVSAENVIV